ncbi:MAG: ATP-dependent DNA helicase UvrD2 [Actinomycetota bacterium]|nr:ATP-dependent DNA helicase UvrD2 [Actinomycetota bacterium]
MTEANTADERGSVSLNSRTSQPDLESLNEEQRLAVESNDSPLRILAGPGAGKTRVLTNRIARRVFEGSADARRVLALTFTRRAAHELRSRLIKMGIRDLGAVGTFHSTALAQIRQHRADQGRRAPTVLPGRRPILTQLAGDFPKLHLKTAAIEVDWLNSQNLTADEYRNGPGRLRIGQSQANEVADLQRAFASYKSKRGLLDFDDILVECTNLLKSDKAFRDAQHWVFRHFFVDEFQDLNRVQFDLLTSWIGDRTDLCIVGDPDQAIYGWNGADSSLLSDFCNHFPSAKTISLVANHRSQPQIIRAADAVLERSSRITNEQAMLGEPPTTDSFPTEEEEAVGIARYLRDIRLPETHWSSHAVLARTNEQLELIAEVFGRLQLPYRFRSQGGIFRLPEVKDLVDQLCATDSDFSALATDLFDEFDHGPQKRISELALQYAKENFHASGTGFRNWIRTLRPGDLDYQGDGVDLATFHSAKGLEWPSVVVAGLEQGLVPIRSDDSEERRLLYVAISRAQHKLHLTWARTRQKGGLAESREPSPWLALIEASTQHHVAPSGDLTAQYLAEARDHLDTGLHDEVEIRAQRLRDWIDHTARARRVEPSALLPNHLIPAVAEKFPVSLSELAEVTGLGETRLSRVGPEILKVIATD